MLKMNSPPEFIKPVSPVSIHKFSFAQGHRQELSYANKDLANGKRMHGLVAGAFHMHDEEYKGYQASSHWRGVCVLHEVTDWNYDLEVISIERLIKEYGK